MSLPVRGRQGVIGALTIQMPEKRQFGPEEVEYLSAFAVFAGIAIENARLFQREQERREHLEALRSVVDEVGRQVDVRRIMQLIVDRVVALGKADVGLVYLWSAKEGALVPRAWHRFGGAVASHRDRPGEGVGGAVMRDGRGILVNDFGSSPYAKEGGIAGTRLEAVLAEPLSHHGHLLGVLCIAREKRGDPFGPTEQDSLRLFAGHAAIAVEKARLVEELEEELEERERAEAALVRRTRQVEAVRTISDEITRELDVRTLLELIAKRAMELLEADVSVVGVWDEEDQVLVGQAAQGWAREVEELRWRLGEGIVGAAAARRAGILENNYSGSVYGVERVLQEVRLQAVLAEPLIYRGRLLGVVVVGRLAEGGVFHEEDQYTLKLLAAQGAIATENARLFSELNESYNRLQMVQEGVERAERLQALGQLSSGIAYQLNNVLGVVIGQVEELGGRTRDAKFQEGLALVASAAAEGVEIVRRLGGFSLELKESEFEACDLAGLALEAIALTQPRWKDEAERRGRKMRVDVQMDDLPAVLGRSSEIREALTNLILHAVGAMPTGGTITFAGRYEEGFSEENRAGSVVLTVRDTGIGMPEAVREKIFDPFFAKKYMPGHGVGLASVHSIMQRQGGRIGVTSLPTEGNTFTLRFRATKERPVRGKAQEPASPLVPGKRILVSS